MTEEVKSTTEVQEEANDEVSEEELSLELDPEDKELFHQMMEAGVFYGQSKSKTNPLTKKFILTTRSGFEVIDLQKAIEHLKRAAEILKNTFANKGTVLFVGTSPASKNIVKEVAVSLDSPYVTERWLGGTLTNFKTITDRINYFKKLKEDKKSGRLEKYTKKEQLDKDKELTKLSKFFAGIESLDKLPSIAFIADVSKNEYAAREAKQRGIPVIGFLNTNTDPNLIDHPIPANDKNTASVELLMRFLETAALEGKKEAVVRGDKVSLPNTQEAPNAESKKEESKE